MTNANNPHAATDATLRQIFKAMDAHQAQEIREAYYKAIEGLMTLAETLGRRERKRGVLPLGRDTRPQSRSCRNLRPSPQH